MRLFVLLVVATLLAVGWMLWSNRDSTLAAGPSGPPLQAGQFLAEPAAETLAQTQPPAAASPLGVRGGGESLELISALAHLDAVGFEARLLQSGMVPKSARSRLLLGFSLAVEGGAGVARATELARGLDKSEEVSTEELALLALALGERLSRPLPAGAKGSTALVQAMQLRLVEREARAKQASGDLPGAALAWSDVLRAEVDAPWKPEHAKLCEWALALGTVQDGYRWNPRANWPALEITVQPGDSITNVRKRFADEHPQLRVCVGMITRANRLGETIHPGQVLRVPSELVSLLVDLDARFVFYLVGPEIVAAWPVAVGKPGNETTPGIYEVDELQKNPMWFPGGAEPVPFGDPRNPLGTRWIGWKPLDGGKQGLGFHGTNAPETVGSAASDGCIRLQNSAVERLYELAPRGARITVRS